MSSRRHPADDELRAYIDSQPPGSELTETRGRVLARMRNPSQSGQWDMEELVRLEVGRVERAAAEKLSEERDKREAAESTLRMFQDERRRFWTGILGDVVKALVIAAIVWAVSQLSRK